MIEIEALEGDIISVSSVGEGDTLRVYLELYHKKDGGEPISDVAMDRTAFATFREVVNGIWVAMGGTSDPP